MVTFAIQAPNLIARIFITHNLQGSRSIHIEFNHGANFSAHDANPCITAYPPAVHVGPTQISGAALDLYHYPGPRTTSFYAIDTDDATTKLNDRIR